MAKKKRKSSSQSAYFNSRAGFYSLFILAVIVMVTFIKSYDNSSVQQSVLGNQNERGKGEEKRQEKREKIRNEFNVEPEGLKVKFEKENGKIKKELESKNNLNLNKTTEEKLVETIEEGFEEENEAEIASDSSSIIIAKNKIKARTGFPLSIDASTNQLIVTKPDGTTKAVAILPDQAVQNFMRHKKVNLINAPEPPVGTDSADIGDETGDSSSSSITLPGIETDVETEPEVSLTELDGELVYEIKGLKNLKVFGFIPVTVGTTGIVSAENGLVKEEKLSFLVRLLSLISL